MDLTSADQRDVNESIHAFEAAVSAQKTSLGEPELSRILVAVDGSNQDDTTIALAAAIALRHDAALRVVYAPEHDAQPGDSDMVDVHVAALREQGASAEPVHTDHTRRSFDQILDAVDHVDAQLVIVDAPYLDDFEALGEASVGTNLQMLMSRSRIPLLVVRRPIDDAAALLARVMLGVTLHRAENHKAAEWSLKLLADGGDLRIVAVVDHATLDLIPLEVGDDRDLADADPEFLAGLRRPDIAGLIAAVHRTAAERSLGSRVSVRIGEVVPVMSDLANEEPRIVVAACPRDPVRGAYQRVEGLIRASANPVLVV